MKKQTSKWPARQKLRALAIKPEKLPINPEPGKEPEAAYPKFKLSKILLKGLAGLLILITGAAVFISLSRVSLADVYLADLKIKATTTQGQLKQEVTARAATYQLKLLFPGNRSKTYSLNDAGISVDSAASAAAAKKTLSHSFISRFTWWRPIKLKLVTKVDKTKMSDFITTQATAPTKAPQNANLIIKNGAVTLIPEADGVGSGLKNPQAAILNSASIFSAKPLVLEAIKLEPSITSKDLEPSQIKAEKILTGKVILSIDGKTVTASPSDIGGWIDFSPVPSAKTVDVTVNSGKVLQYINRIARPYIQPPRSRLVMQTTAGMMVLDAGADGVDVQNKDQTAASVAQAVLTGKGFSGDLLVSYAPAQTVEVQLAPKWIIVDVTTKRMYAYEQTSLVKSFLISGGAPKTPTVLGRFAVYSKFVKQNMRGNNADGSRYFQPNVPYINYFFKDYAIHGNYWRPPSYFGNVNSSHGCVGVMTTDAAWIYNWAPVGTPVIVHK